MCTPDLAEAEPNRALMGAGITYQQIRHHSALCEHQKTVYRKVFLGEDLNLFLTLAGGNGPSAAFAPPICAPPWPDQKDRSSLQILSHQAGAQHSSHRIVDPGIHRDSDMEFGDRMNLFVTLHKISRLRDYCGTAVPGQPSAGIAEYRGAVLHQGVLSTGLIPPRRQVSIRLVRTSPP
jgi:hypothetical protein